MHNKNKYLAKKQSVTKINSMINPNSINLKSISGNNEFNDQNRLMDVIENNTEIQNNVVNQNYIPANNKIELQTNIKNNYIKSKINNRIEFKFENNIEFENNKNTKKKLEILCDDHIHDNRGRERKTLF